MTQRRALSSDIFCVTTKPKLPLSTLIKNITLLVKDDQGNTVVDHVRVTISDSYVIDTLKLNAIYSVHSKALQTI